MSRADPRARVLAYSRIAGGVLGLAAIVATAAAVVQLRAITNDEHVRGRVHARAFIARVRACHRTPPHPPWADCERLVQGAE